MNSPGNIFDSALVPGGVAFVLVLVLVGMGVPVVLVLFLIGAGGYILYAGWDMFLGYTQFLTLDVFSNHSLIVIPLFLLMGALAQASGISRDIFASAKIVTRHSAGSNLYATLLGCAGFGAICGSSLATLSAMGRISLPEMRRQNYAMAPAAACLAAGGTLGILVPPSIILVIFAVQAELNIAELFIAALLPALLALCGYLLASFFVARRLLPDISPDRVREKLSLLGSLSIIAVFGIMIGGLYQGWFTASEAAGIGILLIALIGLLRGDLRRWSAWQEVILQTAALTAAIFLLLWGAALFNGFLALIDLPQQLSGWITDISSSAWLVVAAILVAYVILGTMMDSLSLILITLPVMLPVIQGLDMQLVQDERLLWFGILTLSVVEIGLITPPIGMNLFVVKNMVPEISLPQLWRALAPYLLSDLVRVGLILAFPAICLVLL